MKKWIYRLLLVVCAGVFAYSAYNLYLIYSTKAQIDSEVSQIKEEAISQEKEKEVNAFVIDWKKMKEKNDDIVAWVYVPDCNISYPVLHSDNNSFYLDHSVNKEFNELGSIFLDYENTSDFSDYNSIIYGHSVQGTGGMFTDLKKFEKESFFKKHKYVYLFTPDGNYKGNILCFAKTTDGAKYYDITCVDEEEHIETLKKEALFYNDIETDGHLLTLSTCNLDYGLYSTERYVVVSVLEPTDEPIEVK